MNNGEIWKPIPGCLYEASSLGRIRRAVGGRGARRGHVLSPYVIPRSGHLVVQLCQGGCRRKMTVNRLVALAFRGLTMYTSVSPWG